MRVILFSIISVACLLNACKPSINKTPPSAGNANFARFVAVGNSLCAGFSDGALSNAGQKMSYPIMLSEQFALVGGGSFKTPFMATTGHGNDGSDGAAFYLAQGIDGALSPVRYTDATPLNDNATIATAGPYNHIGVPGARAIDATYASGLFNPFLGRITINPSTGTMLNEAMRINPTFFSYWLGSNDVLGWSLRGGIDPIQTNPATFPFPNTLTHPDGVKYAVELALDTLTKNGAKGVVANIPDVSSTPYFTTIPFQKLLTRQTQVDSLNTYYDNGFNTIAGVTKINWVLGNNPYVIADAKVVGGIRKATENDYILLTSLTAINNGVGLRTALNNAQVLDSAEVAIAQAHTNQYNNYIAAAAQARGLALVDINSYFKTFSKGINYNGVSITPTFATGGAFSLDGIHPTPRGYALVCNEFIKAINSKYGSTIPQVDVNKYPATLYPK